MQHATAYLKAEGYYVHSDSQTVCGVWVASRPFTKFPLDVSSDTLWQAIHDSLAASKTGIEHPTDWDAVEHPLPELASVKSWSQFMKKARFVSIGKADGVFTFTPYKNCGPREGFVPKESPIVVPDESDANQIATALADAFARCD